MLKDSKYIQFPLCLIQETYRQEPSKAIEFLLRFGIANFAAKISYSMESVAKQTMYAYYRERHKMPVKLRQIIEKQGIAIDEDYNGFSSDGKEFDPVDVPELLELLSRHPVREYEAIRLYQVKQAAEILNLSLPNYYMYSEAYDQGLDLQAQFESKYGKDVMPMIKAGMLIQFRDHPKDIDLLRAYIAIKSLIGRKKYVSTCKSIILQRMIGCKSKLALEEAKHNQEIEITYNKFSRRRQMDGLLAELVRRKFITKLSYGRQIYVTNAGTSLGELTEWIYADKAKRDLKKAESNARRMLNELLNQ